MYDVAIIGGGPAGVAAGVYAARKRLKTIFITEAFGGQSIDSVGIENWIGTQKISGLDLAKALEVHLRAYAADILDIKAGERAGTVEQIAGSLPTGRQSFAITTPKGRYEAHAVLVASGGMRRKLEVPGAKEFENRGLTYCASCDGPLFAGQDVVVVGGGNAGFETASQLLAYCKSVTLMSRSDFSRADATTAQAVTAHQNFKGLKYTMPTEIKGSPPAGGFVSAVVAKDSKTGEVHEIPATGVFVEIGMLPSTDFIKNLLKLDQFGRIIVDAKNQHTSIAGVWAAGDCTDELYHQNNIAAGDAVKALEDIYIYLKTGK